MSTDQVVNPEGTSVEQPSNTPTPVDYWGAEERHLFHFPDGVQWFEFSVMDEGAKVRYQKRTNQDFVIGRDQSTRVRVDPSSDRHALIELSVVDWHFFRNGELVRFTKDKLLQWLSTAPPKIVEDIEFAIRMKNPWMQSEMTTEEIDKEIERLYETRKQVADREAGEDDSKSK